MLLFMLSLGGIPPTAGFMGKFWLFGAAIDAQYYWLAVIGVLNSAISLYYYVRIVVFMYLKKEAIGSEPTTTPALALALGVAVAATLRARRLSAAAVRVGRGVGADARRGRSRGRAALSAGCELSRDGEHQPTRSYRYRDQICAISGDIGSLVKFFTRYAILAASVRDNSPFAMADKDNGESPLDAVRRERCRSTAEQAGPAAGASYTLIGAIILLGGIGYAHRRWRGTSPWFLVGGLLLGIVVGMYELAKTVWHK